MEAFFSPDSKIMQALSWIADLVILNFLFLLTCLPIFTIGAASSALYAVCFRLGTEREGALFSTYFSAFRRNFRQGTLLFLLILLAFALSLFNISFFSIQSGALSMLQYPFVLLAVVIVMIYSYVFPWLSQFDNSPKATLKNSLLLSVAYLPRTLLVSFLNVFPMALLIVNLYTFLSVSIVWLFFYFSAAAYVNSWVLRKVFAPYLSAQQE